MFTGIITTTTKIISINSTADIYIVVLECFASDITRGESITVDGICLNVDSCNEDYIFFDVPIDIFKASNFRINKLVNIERATRTNKQNLGHFITGKIDQLATVKYSEIKNNQVELTLGDMNKSQLKYLSPKCAIAINGISLEISKVAGSTLAVTISPSVIARTNLKLLRPEDVVHVEYCIITKNTNKERVYHLQSIDSIN